MSQINDGDSPLTTFKTIKRKVIRLSPEELVTTGYLSHEQQFPLVMQPHNDNVDLHEWVKTNSANLERALGEHGAILFRGFKLQSPSEFERFIRAVSGDALEYNERTSPRSQISGRIYTSTDYPPDKRIFLHNEQSYNLFFPMKIFFYCSKAPETGGATPIADTRRVFGRIAGEIRERLMNRKYMYVRNFGDGFGLSWQEAFQTTLRSEVEDYCRRNQIEYEWKTKDRLRTKQVREVAIKHPRTGDWVWFNHSFMSAHLTERYWKM
jgi:alpha-ketoglutarate-dependent taurine dioxygenase